MEARQCFSAVDTKRDTRAKLSMIVDLLGHIIRGLDEELTNETHASSTLIPRGPYSEGSTIAVPPVGEVTIADLRVGQLYGINIRTSNNPRWERTRLLSFDSTTGECSLQGRRGKPWSRLVHELRPL